jgi:predicted metal-binding membrane protein
VAAAGLVMVAALAWTYLVYLAWGVQQPMDMSMSQVRPWDPMDFGMNFIMWAVMMTAMMVPTAAPMILTFATINRRRREREQPFVPTGVFISGYLMWFGSDLPSLPL